MELLSIAMETWVPLGLMISVELLSLKWKPSNRKNLDYFMKTPKTNLAQYSRSEAFP
jgi:hypothetical protein